MFCCYRICIARLLFFLPRAVLRRKKEEEEEEDGIVQTHTNTRLEFPPPYFWIHLTKKIKQQQQH